MANYPPRKCAYEKCDVIFTPYNSRHKYHCSKCYRQANREAIRSYQNMREAEQRRAERIAKQKAKAKPKNTPTLREVANRAAELHMDYGMYVSIYKPYGI